MATIENLYVGDGSTVLYSFTFPYIEETDVKVSVDSVDTTEYVLANATTVQFNTAPGADAAIRIYRSTNIDAPTATFFPGSAIRAQDLNDNFAQVIYITQESGDLASGAEDAAKEAVTAANEAVTAANEAVTQANATIGASDQAVATANAADARSIQAVNTSNSALSSAATASATATAAETTANEAITKADSTLGAADDAAADAASASASALTAQTSALEAATLAGQAQASAVSAQSSASSAAQDANQALITANNANATAQGVAQDAADADTKAEQALAAVADAASDASDAASAASAAQASASAASASAAQAVSDAASATAAAGVAESAANDASSDAASALSAAQAASTAASAAQGTADQAVGDAASAVSTANSASTAASNAQSAADSAASAASSAQGTANTGVANAATAQSAANSAASDAATAQATANSAVTAAGNAASDAATAQGTANQAISDASAALSRANLGVSDAAAAQSTADTAISTANSAASAVSALSSYDIIPSVGSIPGSPADQDLIKVTDSTGIESFSPLSGLPGGFVGDPGLSVDLRYGSSGNTWTYLGYVASDPDSRYANPAQIATLQGDIDSTTITADAALPKSGGTMSGSISFVSGQTFDGRDVSVDGAKLDGIESGATANRTPAEILDIVADGADSNIFTNAEKSKLAGIEDDATGDQTATEIRALVASASNSNVYTDSEKSKLGGIESGATGDQDASEIRVLVGSAIDSNVFTDSLKSKLEGIDPDAGAQVNADWNATSGEAEILNKPSIPSVVSDLTNDAGYITSSASISGNAATATSATTAANATNAGNSALLENQPGSHYLNYFNFTNTPTVPETAADIGAATSAQGVLAESAVQPGENITQLNNNAGYLTSSDTTQFLVNNANDTTSGTITAAGFVGDGSQLTNLPDQTFNGGTITGDIVISGGDLSAVDVTASGDLSVTGTVTSGDINVGAITSSGSVTATSFVGDGSALTGLLEEAPTDGQQYARQSGSWSVVTGGGGGGSGPYSGPAAWGNVTSGGSLSSGLNIASVTRTNTGVYDVVFTTPMPNAEYAVTATATGPSTFGRAASVTTISATGFTLQVTSGSDVTYDQDFYFTVFSTNALPPARGTGSDAWATVEKQTSNGACTVPASFNVDSVTRASKGLYNVVFTTPMPTANYSIVGSSVNTGDGSADRLVTYRNQSPTGFSIDIRDGNGSSQDGAFNCVINATNATLPATIDEETIRAAAQNPGASAWGKVESDGTLEGGLNVASVTRTSSGQYAIVFARAMPNADYAVNCSAASSASAFITSSSRTSTGFTINVNNSNGASTNMPFAFTVFATNALPARRGTGTDAWALIDRTTSNGPCVVPASFNIASAARVSAGVIQCVFTSPMPTANYAVQATIDNEGSTADFSGRVVSYDRTVNGFKVQLVNGGGTLDDRGVTVTVNATNATLPTSFTESQIQGVIDAGPQGIAKAWVNFDGRNNVIIASYNVESVTDNGTGDYTINFATSMSDEKYTVNATVRNDYAEVPYGAAMWASLARYEQTAGATRVICQTTDGSLFDVTTLSVVVFGS
tara:strand:- start:755 stop:5419 length:4665 start_codon:yes stop_codon:yes gene_type:complete